MGKHAKLKEKQKWSEEKLHLENARKLQGIYFIEPEDTELKETIKNARKKLETVAPAMPCKIMKNCGSGGSDKNRTKLACILEANESTRMRMVNSTPSIHEDHIAGKGENSLQLEIKKKTANMVYVARILGEHGQECQIEGETKKWSHAKLLSITHENCERSVSLTLRRRISMKQS